LEEEEARGEVTGPSLPCRVAGLLSRAGIVHPAGTRPDPWGKVAGGRLEAIASWGGLDKPPLERLRQLQDDFYRARVMSGQRTSRSAPTDTSARPADWRHRWKFW
jgi:hypothetical protein